MEAVNYPSLSEMYSSSPYNVGTGRLMMGMERQKAAEETLARNAALSEQERSLQEVLNPLKVKREQALLDRDSELASYEKEARPLKLSADQYKLAGEKAKYMGQLGEVALQIGSMAKQNGGTIPLQWQQHVPAEFMEILKRPGGADTLIGMGNAAVTSTAKWLAQQSKQESAEDTAAARLLSAENRAREDRLSRERIAASRLESARKLAADKRATSSDKKTLEQYAQDLLRAANEIELDNPEAARVLMGRYQKALTDAQKLKSAGAAVGDEFKRQLLNLPGRYTNQPPAQAAPAATEPADPYAGFKIK